MLVLGAYTFRMRWGWDLKNNKARVERNSIWRCLFNFLPKCHFAFSFGIRLKKYIHCVFVFISAPFTFFADKINVNNFLCIVYFIQILSLVFKQVSFWSKSKFFNCQFPCVTLDSVVNLISTSEHKFIQILPKNTCEHFPVFKYFLYATILCR